MKYYRSFDDMLKDHMAKGFSYASFHGVVGATKEEVDGWLESEESFRRTLAVGKGTRRKALEQLLLGKLITLDIFEHLTTEDADTDVSGFDDVLIEQARSRFA